MYHFDDLIDIREWCKPIRRKLKIECFCSGVCISVHKKFDFNLNLTQVDSNLNDEDELHKLVKCNYTAFVEPKLI